MTSQVVENDLKVTILKNVSSGKNLFSALLNDRKIVKTLEDVDLLVTELCKMAALSLVKLEPIENEDNEKDVKIELTDIGKAYLKYIVSTP